MIECLLKFFFSIFFLWQSFCFQVDHVCNGKRLSYCCAYTAFISFEFFMVYSSAYVYMFMVFMCDDSCVDLSPQGLWRERLVTYAFLCHSF